MANHKTPQFKLTLLPQRLWLAGLGSLVLFGKAVNEGIRLFHYLADQGEIIERRERDRLDRLTHSFKKQTVDKVATLVENNLNSSSQTEFDKLKHELNLLRNTLDTLRTPQSPTGSRKAS
ncbi:phasin family protein [Zooshikella marina]|uniref:phasin family protein n=1 Tax=Zooshikella ganghwensis TaxID=202772 RepID=UPI001BAFD84A|nr:phasin family protein [Zooshikella ganghwensis]MBU2704470.1 phasin family protein [Zooshikella ganghwensis]